MTPPMQQPRPVSRPIEHEAVVLRLICGSLATNDCLPPLSMMNEAV